MTKTARRLREPDEDRLGREAFINLYLASRQLTDQLEKICREEKIAMSHYAVLWFLSRKEGPDGVPMGSVIDGHLNRASDATRLADRLTELGFIERLPSPTDRRVVLVRITATGRSMYLRLTRRIRALHREQWSGLAKKELTELNRLLAKVLWDDDAATDQRHPLIVELGVGA